MSNDHILLRTGCSPEILCPSGSKGSAQPSKKGSACGHAVRERIQHRELFRSSRLRRIRPFEFGRRAGDFALRSVRSDSKSITRWPVVIFGGSVVFALWRLNRRHGADLGRPYNIDFICISRFERSNSHIWATNRRFMRSNDLLTKSVKRPQYITNGKSRRIRQPIESTININPSPADGFAKHHWAFEN